MARKLGVSAGQALLLDGAAAGFTIEGLPDGVRVDTDAGPGPYDIVVCFCPDAARLQPAGPSCTR